VDPSKREEDPPIERRKDHHKSDISADNGKKINNLRQIKQIKESQSLDLNSADSESPGDNRTDVHVLTPLLGADSEHDLGDSDSHRSQERQTFSKSGGRYETARKDKEGAATVMVIPSKSFDNSITVVKHLKHSEVSKILHNIMCVGSSALDCVCS
jgi:hypothetical protein